MSMGVAITRACRARCATISIGAFVALLAGGAGCRRLTAEQLVGSWRQSNTPRGLAGIGVTFSSTMTLRADMTHETSGRFTIPSGAPNEDMRGCTVSMVTRSRWALGGSRSAPTLVLTEPSIAMSATGCDDPGRKAAEHDMPAQHPRSESPITLRGNVMVVGAPTNIPRDPNLPGAGDDQVFERVGP